MHKAEIAIGFGLKIAKSWLIFRCYHFIIMDTINKGFIIVYSVISSGFNFQ